MKNIIIIIYIFENKNNFTLNNIKRLFNYKFQFHNKKSLFYNYVSISKKYVDLFSKYL